MSNNDLWVEASFDAEAARHEREFTALRVEASQYWTLLAGAEHESDFRNRLAMVSDRLDEIVEGITDDPARRTALRSELDAAFAQDFAVVAATHKETVAGTAKEPKLYTCKKCNGSGTVDADGHPTGILSCTRCGGAGGDYNKGLAETGELDENEAREFYKRFPKAKTSALHTADSDWVWVATHNLVGYLPMNDEPYGHDTWEGAKGDMLEQLDRAATSAADGDEDYAEYDEAIADLKASNGPEWGTIIGNLSYWINKVPRADYEGTPHFEGARHTADTHMPDANNIMAPHCTTCGKPIYWDKKNKVIYHDHGSPTAARHTAADGYGTVDPETGKVTVEVGQLAFQPNPLGHDNGTFKTVTETPKNYDPYKGVWGDYDPNNRPDPKTHDFVSADGFNSGGCAECGYGLQEHKNSPYDGESFACSKGNHGDCRDFNCDCECHHKQSSIAVTAGFTRQHFEHIADTIHSAPVDDATRKVVANHFGSHLSGTNPNFDRGKFVDAATNGFKAKSHAKSNFTRQHFQSIADGIKSAPVDSATRGVLANHFATNLAGTNPNFKRDRFLKAAQGSVHEGEFHFAVSSYVTGKNGTEYEWGYDHDPEGTMSTAPNGVIVYLYDAETHEVVDSMGGVDVSSKQISDHGNTNLSNEDEEYCRSVAQEMADGQGA